MKDDWLRGHVKVVVVTLFLCGFLKCEARRTEADHFIRKYPTNQELVNSIQGRYEIAYPFQIRDHNRVGIDTRNYYYSNATVHFEKAVFVLKSAHGRLKVYVWLNKGLIPDDAIYRHMLGDGANSSLSAHSFEQKGSATENCYYQGYVHGEEASSKVALSTCRGLKGVIFVNNETYIIHPLVGGDKGRRHPHLFYKTRYTGQRRFACGNTGFTEWDMSLVRKQTSHTRRRSRRDSATVDKYVELEAVIDSQLLTGFQDNFSEALAHTLEALNVADMIYQQLQTHITLVSLEAWGSTYISGMTLSDDLTPTLLNFIDYTARHTRTVRPDAALLVSPANFRRNELGMGAAGSVCTQKAAAIAQDLSRFESHQLGVVVAHVLGHVLGMRHDPKVDAHLWTGKVSTEDCLCPNSTVCLMSESFAPQGSYPHYFSECSVRDYHAILDMGGGRCLFNPPLQADALLLCGNKVVDHGEQCDCGSSEECEQVDPCCDPVTCMLRATAHCASGPCCDQCRPKPRTHLCRAVADECDVPEYCDGKNGFCPPDAYKMNGVECAGRDGYCYLGMCSTANAQCRQFWGPESTSSAHECYAKFNVLGMDIGNCGRTSTDLQGVPCDAEHVLCGLVQCQNGAATPIVWETMRGDYTKTEFSQNGQNFECKVYVPPADNVPITGLARNGTKCGLNKICVDQRCLPISSVTSQPHCPTNNLALHCSGHGVCTNLNVCYCDPGWSLEDCSMQTIPRPAPVTPALKSATEVFEGVYPVAGTVLPSDAFNKSVYAIEHATMPKGAVSMWPLKLDTYTMLIILGGVAGGVVIIFLFLVMCYRRRSSSMFRKKKLLTNGGSKVGAQVERPESESSMDTAHRSIKFGSTPSYRDEKAAAAAHLRQKKRHRHHLQSVRETSDEMNSLTREESGGRMCAYQTVDPPLPALPALSAAITSPTTNRAPPPPPSERGILKHYNTARSLSDAEACTPLMARAARSARDGYESDTYVSCKIFEQSLRRLNECDIYRNPTDTPTPESPKVSNAANYVSSRDMLDHRRRATSPPEKLSATVSPFLNRQSPPDRGVRLAPEEQHAAMNGSRKPGTGTSSSPTHSTASSSYQCAANNRRQPLTQPQPLELRNIEYLLRQMDSNLLELEEVKLDSNNGEVNGHSLSNSSSAELSIPEADKYEVGSATESHDGRPTCLFTSMGAQRAMARSLVAWPNGKPSRNGPTFSTMSTSDDTISRTLELSRKDSPASSNDGDMPSLLVEGGSSCGPDALVDSFNSSAAETVVPADGRSLGSLSSLDKSGRK